MNICVTHIGSTMADASVAPVTSKESKHNGSLQMQQSSSFFSLLSSLLVVISTALIIFAAARNSITWACQSFWGISGDFWQAQWLKCLHYIGEDPFVLWVFYPLILTFVSYWVLGGIYTLLDITNKPDALRRYKIQPGTNEPVDNRRLMKAITLVVINQTIVTFPCTWLSYYAIQWRGYQPIRELPTFHWVLFEMGSLILIEEICFYYSHRLLHSKYLYKYIHKKHHEWTAPIAVIAVYANPIEHIFSNLVPPFLGILILGTHVATAYLWLILVIFSTLHTHSGYHLPLLPSPEFHDFHHLKFNQCFGVIGLLDRFHGTDAKFRMTPSFTRHVALFTLASARELYPDHKIDTNLNKSE